MVGIDSVLIDADCLCYLGDGIGPRAAGAVEVRHFPDSESAAPFVVSAARPGDLVLVKGSRGMRMERVVEALLSKAGAPGAGGRP